MRGKFFLVLLFVIITGIQPALAQSGDDAEKPVKEGETVININLASDDEFKQALDKAGDIDLVNEVPANAAKSDKS